MKKGEQMKNNCDTLKPYLDLLMIKNLHLQTLIR
jgi:hypothetical protein